MTIGDHIFKVVTDNSHSGGSFSYAEGKITIGTKRLSTQPCSVLNVIIHEIKEIIQVEQYTRYERPDEEGNYEFHYSHKEHTKLCSRLAGILDQFIV